MNCLLLSPDPRLHEQLSRIPRIQRVWIAADTTEIRSLLLLLPIDVLLLPVVRWDWHLFEGLSSLPIFVFLSSAKENYTEELSGQVPYHLIEPYEPGTLIRLFQKIATHPVMQQPDFIFVKNDRRYKKIHFDDIELIERKNGQYSQCKIRLH